MFVNYFADDVRKSPLNLAVARLVLGVWLAWKTVWYDWSEFVNTPYRAVVHPAYEWAIPVSAPWLLTGEKWLLIALLGLFIVGYRVRGTATACMLIAAHLGTVRYTLQRSGETQSIFIGVMMFLFFALYAEHDRFSLDEVRRSSTEPREKLVERLQESTTRRWSMPSMKFGLLVLAIIYFGSGVDKILSGPGFGFARADNIARIMTLFSPVIPEIESLFLNHPILLAAGGWGTLVLETGFLIAVVAGISITPFALGIIGFTLTNLAVLGIFFVDALFFMAMFVAYDDIHSKLALDREIDVVFDEHCQFCMSTLVLFKYLDTNGTVKFHTQQSAPLTFKEREDVDLDRAMYVFHGPVPYKGYYAFRELLRQYKVFLPLVWLMGMSSVSSVGERAYRYVAENRSRYFTCGSDS